MARSHTADSRGAQQPCQQLDRVALLQASGGHHAGQHLPGLGPLPGGVAAPLLTADHSGTDGVLGAPVGRLHPRPGQEGEQRIPLAAQMVQQPPVGRIDRPTGDELVDLGAQPPSLGRGTCLVQLAGVTPIPDRQHPLEDAADGVRGLGLASLGVGEQLTAAAQ